MKTRNFLFVNAVAEEPDSCFVLSRMDNTTKRDGSSGDDQGNCGAGGGIDGVGGDDGGGRGGGGAGGAGDGGGGD